MTLQLRVISTTSPIAKIASDYWRQTRSLFHRRPFFVQKTIFMILWILLYYICIFCIFNKVYDFRNWIYSVKLNIIVAWVPHKMGHPEKKKSTNFIHLPLCPQKPGRGANAKSGRVAQFFFCPQFLKPCSTPEPAGKPVGTERLTIILPPGAWDEVTPLEQFELNCKICLCSCPINFKKFISIYTA